MDTLRLGYTAAFQNGPQPSDMETTYVLTVVEGASLRGKSCICIIITLLDDDSVTRAGAFAVNTWLN